MKRKIIIILAFIACLFLTSCCAPADYSGYDAKPNPTESKPREKKNEWQPSKKEYFTRVNDGIGSVTVLRHNATGILYLINYEGGVVMLVNPDGTPYVQN